MGKCKIGEGGIGKGGLTKEMKEKNISVMRRRRGRKARKEGNKRKVSTRRV